jgi:hypothetical protein
VFVEGLPKGGPFLYAYLMIVVVKNNSESIENTVYLTPKEKRGAANEAEFGATIAALGLELQSLTTDKKVMVNARVLTVTDRFTTFVFDAEATAGDTSANLSGPSWPEGYIQYRVVERASSSDVRDISATDVILEKGLGYLTRGDQTGILFTEAGDQITKEDGGLLLQENATTTADAYQEVQYSSHTDDDETFTYYE